MTGNLIYNQGEFKRGLAKNTDIAFCYARMFPRLRHSGTSLPGMHKNKKLWTLDNGTREWLNMFLDSPCQCTFSQMRRLLRRHRWM